MTKKTYFKKHLIWGSHSRGLESMTIRVGGMAAAGRHGAGAVAESLHHDPQAPGRDS